MTPLAHTRRAPEDVLRRNAQWEQGRRRLGKEHLGSGSLRHEQEGVHQTVDLVAILVSWVGQPEIRSE